MKLYIKGMGCISPQKTWGPLSFYNPPIPHHGARLACVEPDYEQYIDVRSIRRMSRVLKMGVASAKMALAEARTEKPDGIITGTGFGCLEDTGVFLSGMIEKKEQNLNPTPFIQSTHNTIGSQIALMLQCHGHNQTFTHDGLSFESALLDAMLCTTDNPDHKLLVGGVDEITEASHAILSRFRLFRQASSNNLALFLKTGNGALHGEGASWFVVSGEYDEGDKACIQSVISWIKPSREKVTNGIDTLLEAAGLVHSDIDLVLLGISGDSRGDSMPQHIVAEKFQSTAVGHYKHLCGEYPVASAFALWLATSVLHEQQVPVHVAMFQSGKPLRHVLIYNQYFGAYQSLILVSSCRDMPKSA